MNSHDIELPELPKPPFKAWMTSADAEAYGKDCAIADIEADRKVRCEPVAWLSNLNDPHPHAVTSLKYMSVASVKAGVKYVPVYSNPQIPEGYTLVPIEPTKEMLHAAATSGGLGMDYHEYMGRFTLAYKAAIKESLKNQQESYNE